MNQKLDHDQYVRAALVERIMNGNPNHPSAAVMAKNGENLSDALHLIRARQDAYQAEHSNYACHMIYSENLGTDDELIVHVRKSHYGVQVFGSGLNASRTAALQYGVTAMPNTESNPPVAPSYCVDENKTIRRFLLFQKTETRYTHFGWSRSLNCIWPSGPKSGVEYE